MHTEILNRTGNTFLSFCFVVVVFCGNNPKFLTWANTSYKVIILIINVSNAESLYDTCVRLKALYVKHYNNTESN